jgi:DNA-binding NtrC family response regulator
MITLSHDFIPQRESKPSEGCHAFGWGMNLRMEARGSIHRKTSPVPHILVADDEPEIRKLNAVILMDAGYVVNTVEDGLLAWEALQQRHYDLLITDNEMPRMSGLKLVEKLSRNRICLPTIMATGTPLAVEFILQPWFSNITVLLKPYPLNELLAAIKLALKMALGDPVVSRAKQAPYHKIISDHPIGR